MMMKIFIAIALMTSATIVLANEAPVVDVNQNTQQIQQQLTGSATTTDANGNTQTAPVNSANQNPNNANGNNDSSNMTNPNIIGSSTMPQPAVSDVENLKSLPINNRVSRLEQQMANLTSMNLPEQIAVMRQQVQQLNGQIQVMQHDLTLLNNQQRSFYKDLQQQIEQIKNLNGSSDSNNNNKKPTTQTKPPSTDINLKDATAYKKAFNLVLDKKYESAKQALQNYISTFPQGEFQPNARYWLGEIFMMNKQWQQALDQFNVIVTKYKNSQKVPDAKLKIALIYLGMGKVEQAKQELQSIREKYPNSTAAQLASIQLQQLNVQGK
jgi:tol-pal system protein YbgF